MPDPVKSTTDITRRPGNRPTRQDVLIFTINLTVFALYSLLLVVFAGDGRTSGGPDLNGSAGRVFDYILLIIIHFIICLVSFIITKKPSWLISGVLVLFGFIWGKPLAILIRYLVGLF
jgi:hypothetical protein